MDTRSRLTTRARNQSRASSDPSTPDRNQARSTTAPGQDSPHGSSTNRTSDSGNNSPSATLKRLSRSKKFINNRNDEAFVSRLPNNDRQQKVKNVTTDEDVDLIDDEVDELPEDPRTTTQSVNRQSSVVNTISTADVVQNLSLTDNSSVIPKDLHGVGLFKSQALSINNLQVYQFFEQMPNDLFQCKLCKKELKSKKYNTTNLRKHIGISHKRPEYLYQSQRKEHLPKSQFLTLQRRKELHDAVISCIITDSRSFNDFRKAGMRAFLAVAVPGYIPPHRSTIKAQLRKRYLRHRRLLRSIFSKIPAIALTSDIWKNSRNTHFISLTAHFYDSSFQLVSLTIGFRQFSGEHTAERIRKYLSHEIRSLKISDKICSITTDNASNVVKATTNVPGFGLRISCLAHVLNLIVQRGIKLWSKDSEEDSEDTTPQSSASTNASASRSVNVNANRSTDRSANSNANRSADRRANANANLGSNDIDIEGGYNDGDELDVSVADADDIGYSSSDDDADEENEESDLDSNENSTDDELADDEQSDSEDSCDAEENEANINTQLTDDTLLNVFKIIVRVRILIRLVRRSSFLRDCFKKESREKNLAGDGLILDVRVRWNSSFYTLRRFIAYQDLIHRITMNPRAYSPAMGNTLIYNLKCSTFNHDEWEYIFATNNVLSTFEQACRLISGRRYQTLSIAYIVVVGLGHHLSRSSGSGAQNKIEKILNGSLSNAYDYHINDKINFKQKYAMLIACFLDPQTYHAMSDDDREQAESTIIDESRLRTLPQQITTVNHVSSNSNDSALSPDALTGGQQQINSFLIGCGLHTNSVVLTKTHTMRTIKEEIAYYIDQVKHNVSFEEFWRTYHMELPFLTSLVRCFSIRPSSSVASESLFSVAAYVNRKQRCSLSSETLMYSMILRDAEVVERLSSK